MNEIPRFKIGDLEMQGIVGAMGVDVSGENLVVATAENGWAGIIAAVGLGARYKYPGKFAEANCDALRDRIRAVRNRTDGVVGVNVMHALTDYDKLVKTAVEEDVDLIISGAGIPRDLPSYLDGKDIMLVPIVSSVRVTKMICKSWNKCHVPDAIIVEGPKAGGHLGYRREDLDNPSFVATGLEKLVPEIIDTVKDYGDIPVIVAGGIFYGSDIKKFNDMGVAGVQMATRFVATEECDADDKFKQAYLDAKKSDLIIIDSPVGMPGRALMNPFLERILNGGREEFKCEYKCLKTCDVYGAPYCIAKGLIEAHQGNFEKGFVFAGSNAHLCNEISTVGKIIENLNEEYK